MGLLCLCRHGHIGDLGAIGVHLSTTALLGAVIVGVPLHADLADAADFLVVEGLAEGQARVVR